MSVWNKPSWIKDILSKSGTEITEINENKTEADRKMVYYTAIPLMVQTEHHSSPQLCMNGDDSVRISNISNNQNETQLYNVSSSNMTDQKPIADQSVSMITLTNVRTTNQTSKPQYKCDQCNMFFGSKSAHTSHVKSHAKSNNGQTATTRSVANSNPSSSSANNGGGNGVGTTSTSSADPYQCDVCKKTFAVPARLVRHYRTHTGERPFECEFCHKMFSVKENLQVHRRIHTKERPYKCDVCGRAFEHSGKLHRHMRIHTGERPHKCSVCAKTFIQSGQLVIHMRTHTGEKPYKCPVEGCGKGFTCSKQLKVHSRTHTGEKPYHCDICFRDFGYNHVLKLHRVQHYGSKCYKCTICDETFKSKKEMEAHIKGHANEIPDDEDGSGGATATDESTTGTDTRQVKMEEALDMPNSPISNMPMSSPSPNSTSTSIASLQLPTPRESSSDAHSDGDEISYYNLYTRFDQSIPSNREYTVQTTGSGVNPALLAAVSIATSANECEDLTTLRNHTGATQSMVMPSTSGNNSLMAAVHEQDAIMDHSFIYEPLAVMRQQGYFTPAPKVEEFKSSINATNDIVKRVEAALAVAEPLLTPPRSTPESPDRSSSPDSDVLVGDRDVMSLPLRKRKNYLRDNQESHSHNDDNSGSSSIMRMNSVIKFAKAS